MNKAIDAGQFQAVFVKDGDLLEKAQILRKRVFFKDDGRDEDKFDRFCDHLIVVDKNTDTVAGNYRLLLGSAAKKGSGFYADTEFDLSNIRKNCKGEVLEMGRACVDERYRNSPVISLLWKAITHYFAQNNVSYIFGCASIEDPTPAKIGDIFRFFKKNCYCAPEFRVYPLEGKAYPYSKEGKDLDLRSSMKVLSTLIKGYLKMGAVVCGEPAHNKVLNTAVFFMLLDVAKINRAFIQKFL